MTDRMRAARLAFAFQLASAVAVALSCAACASGYYIPKSEGIDPKAQVDGSLSLDEARLKPSVCEGIDVKPEYGSIDEHSIIEFLKQRHVPIRVVNERSDLVYVELQLNADRDEWVRLRVAMLPTAPQAGFELQHAMLEHGKGWWGIHRGNVAVLVPRGSVDNIVAMAVKTKLACWGVLTVAGGDEAYVIPGGYREL
jgi:hypothetical protein